MIFTDCQFLKNVAKRDSNSTIASIDTDRNKFTIKSNENAYTKTHKCAKMFIVPTPLEQGGTL